MRATRLAAAIAVASILSVLLPAAGEQHGRNNGGYVGDWARRDAALPLTRPASAQPAPPPPPPLPPPPQVPPPPRIDPPACTTVTPNGSTTFHSNQPVTWTIVPFRGDAEYTVLVRPAAPLRTPSPAPVRRPRPPADERGAQAESENLITLQAGREGGAFVIVAAVTTCIGGDCAEQQNSEACARVAAGQELTNSNCNAAYATATWGIVTRWEIVRFRRHPPAPALLFCAG